MKQLHFGAIIVWLAGSLIVAAGCTSTSPAAGSGAIKASGTIDAETVAIAAQYGGRVQEILPEEGDSVSKGQVLIRLDAALIDAQTEYAIAQGQVEAAEAALEQARVEYAGTQTALQPLLDMQANPIEIATEVHTAEAAYHQAEAAVDAAQAQLDLLKAGPTPEVTFIAHEAEFTPRNVQTQEQRANLVFAVKVSLDNLEHLLKPGMPADARLNPDLNSER